MPPAASPLQQSTLDAIVFHAPPEILYRAPGEHQHRPGEGRVSRVVSVQVSRPLGARPAVVENLCGRYRGTFERGAGHDGVTLPSSRAFASMREMYHLEGTLFLFRQRVHFKGCHSAGGLAAIARDLNLDGDTRPDVYMAVFSLTLDRFVHTYHGCYLENRLTERFGSIRVCHRMFDMNMLVKLQVDRFCHREMPGLTEALAPASMGIMVSKKGVVLIRMAWPSLEWSEGVERRLLDFCNWLGGAVRECC
jgi:hypothetical protein